MVDDPCSGAAPASARWGYVKSCRKTGEFAHAIGAVLIDPERGTARAVIGAVDAPPIVIADAAGLFGGRIAGDYKAALRCAGRRCRAGKAGVADAGAPPIHVAVLSRAVREAAA